MKFGKTIPAIACTLSLALGLTGYEAAAAPYAEPPAASEASERTDAESLIMAAETEEAEDTATGNSADASDRASLRPAYYTASDEDLLAAEDKYSSMEANLEFQLENYEILNPGYDEYVYDYDTDDIGHDPYVLLSLLSAYMGGYWTISGAQDAIAQIFDEQYTLTETVSEETCTETVTDTRTETDDETGETVIYVERSEAERTVTVCTVTLEARDLKRVPSSMLSRSRLAEYASYMSILGGAEELFPDSYYQKYITDSYEDYEYDVPEEYLEDEAFAAILSEAERYLGFPYIWGGSYPDTSFDCSGFVWNALCAAGYELERTDAQGLYSLCEEVSEDELKPGDLVFFAGTYETDSTVTHAGIYVGDNMMLHAGDPVQYTNLDSDYWQSHLYAYGRIG